MKVLLISGRQGSGKTTLQNKIVARYEAKDKLCEIINFADPIVEMADEVSFVLHKYWPPRNLVKDGPLMQLIGTEWGRKTIDTNIWVKILQKKIEIKSRDPIKSPDLFVIGDCRFENEFDAFPDALRVRLECSEEMRKKRCSMWRENTTHPSEIGLDTYSKMGMFDFYLDTEKADIEGCVELTMAQLMKARWKDRR